MIRGFYTARSGLINHQENMNIISNNMANVNTTGYKPMRASFTDLMYQNLNRNTAENTAQVGHGLKINKTDIQMNMGPLEPTSSMLDVAILEEGAFFAAQGADGEIRYTRAGNFSLSNDGGDTFYLVTATGDRVLDADGGEIEIEFLTVNDIKSGDYLGAAVGDMNFDPSEIGVYRFSNPYGLHAIGGNRFVATPESGEPEALEEPKIKVSFLEGSGVEMASEMVKVIESSKAFNFSARMVQVADEVEQTVNSLR